MWVSFVHGWQNPGKYNLFPELFQDNQGQPGKLSTVSTVYKNCQTLVAANKGKLHKTTFPQDSNNLRQRIFTSQEENAYCNNCIKLLGDVLGVRDTMVDSQNGETSVSYIMNSFMSGLFFLEKLQKEQQFNLFDLSAVCVCVRERVHIQLTLAANTVKVGPTNLLYP